PRQAQLLPVVGPWRHGLCLFPVDVPQAQLLPQCDHLRPSSCLLAASTGPALASQHPVQAQNCFQPASPGPALPPGCVCRPTSCLTTTTFGPVPGNLCRPQAPLSQAFQSPSSAPQWPGLTTASPGQALASCRPPLATFPPALLMASLGSSCASPWPSAGQASALQQPPQARLLHSDGLLRPSLSLTTVSLCPAFPLWRPLQAQVGLPRPSGCLSASSPGPTLPRRPSPCLQTASFDSAPAQLLPAFVGPKPPPGPALASQQPSQPQLLPHGGLPRPRSCRPPGSLNKLVSCLTLASPGPAPAHYGVSRPKAFSSQPLRPSSCLPPMACAGPKRPEVGLATPSSCLS
ncbi:LOW QUALITY PROTEIN: putative uncharacterized protein FLJ44672, partial [Trachypithecus francoisi]|uniref:LOW QUALITY PROTEIN: putative uncharacterized protein FLJ44672 n=1 Tax=Trachypithecus francoisi TaxID=54180 RepID=UPI00141BCDB1